MPLTQSPLTIAFTKILFRSDLKPYKGEGSPLERKLDLQLSVDRIRAYGGSRARRDSVYNRLTATQRVDVTNTTDQTIADTTYRDNSWVLQSRNTETN